LLSARLHPKLNWGRLHLFSISPAVFEEPSYKGREGKANGGREEEGKVNGSEGESEEVVGGIWLAQKIGVAPPMPKTATDCCCIHVTPND